MTIALLAILALLAAPVAAQTCPGDVDGNGGVTVDEIVRAVDAGLNGCGGGILYDLAGTSWSVIYGDSRFVAHYQFDGAPRVIGSQLRLAGTNTDKDRRVGLEETASGSALLTEVIGTSCLQVELWHTGNTLHGTALAYAADCSRLIDSTVTAIYATHD